MADIFLIQDKSKGWPADISISGSQVLVLRCATKGPKRTDSIAVAVQARAPGPIAVVGHTTEFGFLQCHARWATGVLFDGCNSKQLEIINRNHMGTGHGWTAGSSCVWNCSATMRLVVQKPPTSQNYLVGCEGVTSERCSGLCISPGRSVEPIGLSLLNKDICQIEVLSSDECVSNRPLCSPTSIPCRQSYSI